MSDQPFRIIHLSDTHFGTHGEELLHPDVGSRFEAVLNELAKLHSDFDVIVHTGDIAHPNTSVNRKTVLQALERFEKPVFVVPGNHDEDLPGEANEKFFHHTFKKVEFIGLAAEQSPQILYGGRFSAEQTELLEGAIGSSRLPKVILVHYPLFPIDSRSVDGTVELEDAAKLHELFTRAAKHSQILVLHGHAHISIQNLQDGVAYIGAPSIAPAFAALPSTTDFTIDPRSPAAFNIITFISQRVTVKQCFCG